MISLQTLPALVLWTVVVIRLLGLRFGWKPGILPVAALIAAAVTLNIDPVYIFVDGLLGGWNLLNLIVHVLICLGLTALSRLLLLASGRSDRHWRVLLGVGLTLAVFQVALLLVAQPDGSATNFTDTFGHIPTVAIYQASFFAWIGLILGYTGVECRRRNTEGESRNFGIGIDIVAYGCFSGVLGALMKMMLLGMAMADFDAPHWAYVLYRVFIALAVIGFAGGFIVPAVGRIRGSYAARGRRAAALNSLRPIVRRLAETPEGARSLGAANIDMGSRSSGRQLYRWMIFIGDIRVLDPELLTEQEKETVDEIGRNLEHHDAAVPSAQPAA